MKIFVTMAMIIGLATAVFGVEIDLALSNKQGPAGTEKASTDRLYRTGDHRTPATRSLQRP